MDIGTESPAITIEPITIPVPGHTPEPAPAEPSYVPEPVPVETPELVPA